MPERTPYQDRIIKNYYQNQDALAMQRLGELATELYLASGKKRTQVWKLLESTLAKLKIPPSRIEHLKQQDDATLVAKLVEELLGKK